MKRFFKFGILGVALVALLQCSFFVFDIGNDNKDASGFLFLAALMLMGFDDSLQEPVSVEEAKKIFDEDRDAYLKFVEICKRHPSLNIVDRSSFFFPSEAKPFFDGTVDEFEESFEEELLELVEGTSALSARCYREGWRETGGLYSVSFFLYQVGLMLGGGAVTKIVYVSEKSSRDFRDESSLTSDSEYTKLPLEGWYVRAWKD